MSSRRTPRQLIVAVLVGVLVGGGLLAITPAGAQVSQSVATNWKKIWKGQLQPQADKRYYTKAKSKKTFLKKSDAAATYQPKGSYAPSGSSYTKAESDARYKSSTLIQGVTIQSVTATVAGQVAGDNISFGVTLSAPPTVHYINLGDPNPVGCTGSAAAPNAAPGNLCVWEAYSVNNTDNQIGTIGGTPGATTNGAVVFGSATAATAMVITTAWAVRPLAVTLTPRRAPRLARGNVFAS